MASTVYTDSDLTNALRHSNVEEVEKIMKSGDITGFRKHNSPLTYYLKFVCPNDEQGLPIVKVLVQYESVNYRNHEYETALTYAAQRTHMGIFQFLLEHGYDLHYGRCGGFSSIEYILIMHRCDEKGDMQIPMLKVALPFMRGNTVKGLIEHAKSWEASQEVLEMLKSD